MTPATRRQRAERMKAAIVVSGVREVHIEGIASYATLCGLDGDDPTCEQAMSTVLDDEPVDCQACLGIWQACQPFSRRDFTYGKRLARKKD